MRGPSGGGPAAASVSPRPHPIIASLQALTVPQPARQWHGAELTGIALLLVAIWLVLIAGVGFTLATRREAALREARMMSADLARSVAAQIKARLDTVDLVLVGLSERAQADGLAPPAVARLGGVMAARAAMIGYVHLFGMADAQGRIITSSRPDATAGRTLPTLVSLDWLRAHPDAGRRLGRPVRSIVGDSWVMPLVRRWHLADGSLGGELFGSIDLNELQDSFAALEVGRAGVVSLWLDDSLLLARQPPQPNTIGRTFPLPSGAPTGNERASGNADLRSSIDGVRRTYGYGRVEGYGLTAYVGLAHADVLATWRQQVRLTAAMLAGLIALNGGAGLMLLRRARRRLTAQGAYRLLAESATDMIFCLDTHLARRYVSPASEEILGYAPDRLLGGCPLDRAHPDDAARLRAAFDLVLAGADRHAISCRTRHRDGHWIWVDVQLRRMVTRGSGRVIGIIGALRDASARKAGEAALEAANRHLEALANSDGLTGLANRRHFDERLDHELRRAARDGTELSLLLIDVDRFKPFNDRYGHLAGDAALRMIAEALGASLQRPADLAARYGGEEFAVVLPHTRADSARLVAERIAAAVGAGATPHADGVDGLLTVSIGVATGRVAAAAERAAGSALIAAADRALYAAKAAGRARIEVAEQPAAADSLPWA